MFTLVEELDMRRKKVSGTVIRFFNIKKILDYENQGGGKD